MTPTGKILTLSYPKYRCSQQVYWLIPWGWGESLGEGEWLFWILSLHSTLPANPEAKSNWISLFWGQIYYAPMPGSTPLWIKPDLFVTKTYRDCVVIITNILPNFFAFISLWVWTYTGCIVSHIFQVLPSTHNKHFSIKSTLLSNSRQRMLE